MLATEKKQLRRRHRVITVAAVLTVAALLIRQPSMLEASPGTVTLRPNDVGDETKLTPYPGTGEDNWEDVDDTETGGDGDTTYVENTTGSSKIDLYNLSDVTSVSGKGKINSVTVYIRCKESGKNGWAYTQIKTNGTAYAGTEETLTTSYATYNTAYTTNPQSGNEWTWEEINALQAGVDPRKGRCTQVWVVVDYTPATLESYKEDTHENIWGTAEHPYASDTKMVYMYGTNYIASHGYHVAYYDSGGTKIQSDGVTSTTGNTLSSQYLLTTDPDAVAGTWHAVVFDDDLGEPPATYGECSGAAGYMVEDDFEVAESAIPEFPTVMAGITAVGLCFGIYYWLRKKRLAYVKA